MALKLVIEVSPQKETMLEDTAVQGTSVSGFRTSELGKEMTLIFRQHFARDKDSPKALAQENSPGRRRKHIIPSMITIGPCASSSPLREDTSIDLKQSQDSQDDDMISLGSFRSCLSLLESEKNMEECRRGMEWLMKIVNSELVNFKKDGSVARALVCGDEIGCRSEAERLRKVFLSCFTDQASICFYNERSSDSSCLWSNSYDTSTLTDSRMGLINLKMPALRILTSSLDLVAMLDASVHSRVDLSSTFWMSILGAIAELTEVVADSRLEATLSIKCIRLLHKLQPKKMEPYIRYTLFPYLMHAYGYGKENGDRMLVREAERLIKPLGGACGGP